MGRIKVSGLLLILTLPVCGYASIRDFSRFFHGRAGTIVVFAPDSGKMHVYNLSRARRRYTPFSTFKILNSVVALETGVVKNVDTVFQWDTTRYPAASWWPSSWNRRHTMRSAIRYSVIPFYREIARRIDRSKMLSCIRRFRYGNMNISSSIDKFWLGGSLKISAMEQVRFLRMFHENTVGIGSGTLRAVHSILLSGSGPGYRLYAKTGGGTGFDRRNPGRALGWYVGFVEKGKQVFYFAMNVEGKSFTDITSPRALITRAVLKHLKILP